MPPPDQRLDEHGFPIPATFTTPGEVVAPRPRRAKRGWLILLVVLGVVLGLASLRPEVRRYFDHFRVMLLTSSAQEKWEAGDVKGTLADLDAAIALEPKSAELYEFRAKARLAAKDFPGSLADCDKLVELAPRVFTVYHLRSGTYLSMGRFAEALSDADKAIELLDKPGLPSSERGERAELLNTRAYIRALAKMDVEAGLADAEEALQLFDSIARFTTGTESKQLAMAKSSFLDTRGYLHHLLGHQEEALADLQAAIDVMQSQYDELEQAMQSPAAKRTSEQARKHAQWKLSQWRETLAVMYHHRGLIYEKMGDSKRAKDDLRHGDELGYNPDKGVW